MFLLILYWVEGPAAQSQMKEPSQVVGMVPSGESQGISRPAEKHITSSVSSVFPGTRLEKITREASRATSTGSSHSGEAATLSPCWMTGFLILSLRESQYTIWRKFVSLLVSTCYQRLFIDATSMHLSAGQHQSENVSNPSQADWLQSQSYVSR